jgi:hypothetical protein
LSSFAARAPSRRKRARHALEAMASRIAGQPPS